MMLIHVFLAAPTSYYIICPNLFSLCKYLDRDISIHPTSRVGLCNPDKGVFIHMCCVHPGYHAVVSHVKLNHDTGATDNHRVKLSIRSAQKTWSIFAETFCASGMEIIIEWTADQLGSRLSNEVCLVCSWTVLWFDLIWYFAVRMGRTFQKRRV